MSSHIAASSSFLDTNTTPFDTLASPSNATYEIKGSKFLAFAARADSPDAALLHFERHRDPSATHNCYAYKIRDVVKSSDDGEPGGTAGRPILSCIEAEGLDHVAVLIVRYKAGPSLGTGGLVRAYSAAARAALVQGVRERVTPKRRYRITKAIDYSMLNTVYRVLDTFHVSADSRSEEYDNDGNVMVAFDLEPEREGNVGNVLRESSAGKLGIEPC